jgi:hypothetical protein
MSLRRSNLTAEQRSTQARLAALSRWAGKDEQTRAAETQAARDGLAAKWEAAPNPEAAKRAHMTRLALASSRKRSTTDLLDTA